MRPYWINYKYRQHKELIKAIDNIPEYKGWFKPVKETRDSANCKNISGGDLHYAVLLLIDLLNISGGSIGDINLYALFQEYFLNPQARKEINKAMGKAYYGV